MEFLSFRCFWRRQDRAGIGAERVLQLLPACGHFTDATGLRGGEVVLLAPVGREIEQFPLVMVFAGGDEFVVSNTQRPVAFVVEEYVIA